MARRTKEEAEQTRQALLETALRLFSERGIGQTSLKDIAAETGVTHGALYWHFKNRGDLVRALYERSRLPLDDLHLEQLQAARQDGLSALADFLQHWCRLLMKDPEVSRIWRVFHCGPRNLPELAALNDAITAEHEEWLERIRLFVKKARKQGQLPPKAKGKKDTLPANLLVLVFGLIESQQVAPQLIDGKLATKQVIRNYLLGLQAA
ncbi:TetR family transcriptional regulator [Marinobacterium arenosum]|uniref:TetR family transcriptional regulator n=1 Tax=Marinobacterium arenosum TaxID=2862496 RepID=UPI001C943115|nr:TetR family transcriptional regulator [Marinobacterium arenosum]MBY4678635.1 TetR family transcriptional regulator [Marinobacterium arenosum]